MMLERWLISDVMFALTQETTKARINWPILVFAKAPYRPQLANPGKINPNSLGIPVSPVTGPQSVDPSKGLSDGKMGDPRCWEAPEQTGPGKTCGLNEICYTDLRISWGPYGKQLETISRGCARPRQNECHDNVMDHVHSKQCRHYCNTDIGCNGGLEIQEEFHSTKVPSCNLRIF